MRLINVDPEILGGTPVFYGTRVPIKALFDYLGCGESLEMFLDDFPTVSEGQAVKVLKISEKLLTAKKTLNENSSRRKSAQKIKV